MIVALFAPFFRRLNDMSECELRRGGFVRAIFASLSPIGDLIRRHVGFVRAVFRQTGPYRWMHTPAVWVRSRHAPLALLHDAVHSLDTKNSITM